MLRKNTKFLALLLSSALLASAPGAFSAPVFASETSSTISNESIPDNAESYTLGTEKKLNLADNASTTRYTWYKFTLDQSAICNFTGSFETSKNTNPTLNICDKNGQVLCDIYPNHSGQDSDYTGLKKGTYYIQIKYYDVSGTLTFKLSTVDTDKNYQTFVEDYENTDTSNDSYVNANDLAQGTPCHGIIGSNNNEDWYKLTTSTDTTVTFSITSFKGYGGYLFVYDSSREKKFIGESVYIGDTVTKDLKAGTYYVNVTYSTNPGTPTCSNVFSYVFNTTADPASANQPSNKSTDARGDFVFSYCHEIPFWGKSKLGLSNFGDFTVSYNGTEYTVQKASINKKKHTIQIKALTGADKAINKAVKNATKGSNALTFTVKPYTVSNADTVTIKKKKDGSLRSVKVSINKKTYTAKKTEYSYDPSSKTVTFTGSNLTGSYTIKN
ncbi:hypothetical protein SAMN06296386_12013 [Lachnospiraceae bacterium]|nr:hypothetical protein SAMN06296386_12013 [Lachnospiraceae bacterium]